MIQEVICVLFQKLRERTCTPPKGRRTPNVTLDLHGKRQGVRHRKNRSQSLWRPDWDAITLGVNSNLLAARTVLAAARSGSLPSQLN